MTDTTEQIKISPAAIVRAHEGDAALRFQRIILLENEKEQLVATVKAANAQIAEQSEIIADLRARYEPPAEIEGEVIPPAKKSMAN